MTPSTGRSGEAVKKRGVFFLGLFFLVSMHVLNPDKPAFDHFVLTHVKERQHLRKGAFADQLYSFLGPALIDQMSERKDCYFFSLYSLNLPGQPSRRFIGILHFFLPV